MNLRAGRLIVRNASGQEMTNLLGAGWMSYIKELKLEKCHTSNVEHALNDFFARATELTSLTLQKCHVSEEFAEAIVAHKHETLKWLSGKRLNFQGDAKKILQTARWQCMESVKFK